MTGPRFENLGDEQFQRFCQSILTYEFPDIQALEVGQPDGGRDALDRGPSESFFVFQVKYVRSTSPLKEPEKWVEGVLKGELAKIKRLADRGATKYRLITNAGGSAHLDDGAVDKVNAYLASALPIPADCWWRADLATRVVKHPELRWGYPDLLSPTDVLKELVGNYLTEDASRRMAAIKSFLVAQYTSDQDVRFKQVDLQNDLLNLFVDVPASLQGGIRARKYRAAVNLIRQIGTDSDDRFIEVEPSIGAGDLLLHPEAGSVLPHVVLEGAPGQGKSTLGQYLCQVHRMRLLHRTADLRRIPDAHSTGPGRLPFKIDLRDFASFLQGRDPYEGEPEWGGLPDNYPRSLECFLACTVMRFSGGVAFSPGDLLAVLAECFALIVFDGLDEVAEFRDRRAVVEAIKIGIDRLNSQTIGLQTIVTSRPAAFTQSPGFSTAEVPHLQLRALTPALVVEYAEQWITARQLTPAEGRDVRRVLRQQLGQPHIRDLARNPMQLAILLTLMLTKGDSLPDKRTDLYQSYLSIFFDREATKSAVVRDHRDVLLQLHEYLAWRLHSEAEMNSSGGSISQEDLEVEVRSYLEREGRDVALVDQLFRGMVERVIALVSRVQGRFEFEVQPLREYFAAAYLYSTAQVSTGLDERTGTIIDRFDGLARNPFWLNVVRFYAGFYNSGQLSSLTTRLEALSDDPDWANTDRPRLLATLFLADYSFALERKSREKAIDLVLQDLGWRHTLSVSPMQPTLDGRAGLPFGAGREEMLDKAWRLLMDGLMPEDRLDCLQFLVSFEGDDRRSDWVQRLRDLSGASKTQWIAVGYQSDALKSLPAAEWESLWSDDRVEDFGARAGWALNSGFRSSIEADEQKSLLLVRGLISGTATCYFDDEDPGWIGALGSLLSPYRVTDRNFLRELKEATRRLRHGTNPDSETIQRVRDIVLVTVKLFEESGGVTVEGLNGLTTRCEDEWGEGWGLYKVALAAVTFEGRPRRPGPKLDLCDQSQSVTSRIRYARSKGGKTSGTWWVDQLKSTNSADLKKLCVVAALSWASGAALWEVIPVAATALASFDREDFQEVLEQMGRLEWGRGAGKRLNLATDDILGLPMRVGIALSRRDPKFGKQFEDRIRRYDGRDVEVLRSCLDATAHAVVRGRHVSREDLRLMRRAYKATHGGSQTLGPFRLLASGGSMQSDFAKEIVEDAPKYPLAVVQAAERRCFAQVSRKQPPLLQVADAEQWFAEPT